MLPVMIALAGLTGCKDTGGPTAWALDYATVTPDASAEAIDGVHTWEFFAEGWEKKQAPEYYQCALVQSLEGALSEIPQDCTGCQYYYSITLLEQDSDCDAGLITDPALAGLRGFGVGLVPEGFSEEDPYPGQSLGWYLSFDDRSASFQGFIFAEGLERGEPTSPGWSGGETYTLWPAYAWSL